jgi:CubicO group peptidase (beta-lactamase class C family)
MILRPAILGLVFGILCCRPVFAQEPRPLTSDSVVLNLEIGPDEAPLRFTLGQLMSVYKDPGFSIAVISHDHIAWAKGFGFTAMEGGTAVTPPTLFQAASISKPLTAAGVLWLVQHGQLSLDENVNDKLKSWQVPANDFIATEKVTLRRILSHNAGFNVHGFDGYARSQPLPTIQQTLDGLPPANNPPIRVKSTPGSECNYSGGGYVVAGLVMREAAREPFANFMRQHVLLPSGMKDSTFDQPLSTALAARAAAGTDAKGTMLPGKWRVYPELAPDGLWTTPTDLAKFVIEIDRSARGQANHVLSKESVKEMLTVQCHDDPDGPGGTGLGFALGYQHRPKIFFHNGSNAGFQSVLMMDPDGGWGYVAMANSDNFQPVNRAIFRTLSDLNGWGVASTSRDLGENLRIIDALRNPETAIKYYQYVKPRGFVDLRHDANTLNNFGYDLLQAKKLQNAIRVFQLNVAEFPEDANVYDSLGEAYMDAGKRDLAIQNYERSLKLNPKNDNAVAKLKQLRSE